LTVSVRSG